MREIGLIFQGWGVRAILEGRKTQTRRLVHFHKPFDDSRYWERMLPCPDGTWIAWDKDSPGLEEFHKRTYPNGGGLRPKLMVGDTMYVKETWRTAKKYDPWPPRCLPVHIPLWFASEEPRPSSDFGRLRSPLFLRPCHARIWRTITRVRCQRLQEITPRDAYAEGVIPSHDPIPVGLSWDETVGSVAVPAYRRKWESINGPGSWEKNPWVWVYEW